MCQPVSRPSRVRGSTNTSGRLAEALAQQRGSCAAGASRYPGSLRSCTSPNAALISDGSKFQPTSSKMNRLSYSSPSMPDARISEKKRLSPFREPHSCASERRPHRRSRRHWSTSASSSSNTIPPVPAAVMMCDEREARDADVRRGSRSGCPAASHRARRTSPRPRRASGGRRWRGCGPSRARCR